MTRTVLDVMELLQLADLPAPQLEAVDVADVGLPRLLVPVGVVTVGAVECHVHVLQEEEHTYMTSIMGLGDIHQKVR